MNPNAVTPPWSDAFVRALNLNQTGTQSGWPTHPYTCPSRGDGQHGTEGGDLGVLIATVHGWICPTCFYVQHSAHALTTELQPVAVIGSGGIQALGPSRDELHARIQERIAAYEVLAQRGAPGADSMLRNLQARLEEILAPPAPLIMWVVYEKPLDFPGEFVARRFEVANGKESPTADLLRASSLDALRVQAPPGLTSIPRQAGDDPCIVECWL